MIPPDMMKDRDDLDQLHPCQADITHLIDQHGAKIIDLLVSQCETALLGMLKIAMIMPLQIWQRACYELSNKARVTEEPWDKLKSDTMWNVVNFLQEHAEHSKRGMKFPKVVEFYRSVFGKDPIDLSDL